MAYSGFASAPENNDEKLDAIFNHLKLGEKQYLRKIFQELKWLDISNDEKIQLRELIADSGVVEYEYLNTCEIHFLIKVPVYNHIKSFGSYKNMMIAIRTEKDKQAKNKEEVENENRIDRGLNRKKLWYDHEDAEQRYRDYPKMLRQRNLLFAISIASLIVAAIALFRK